MMEIFLQVFFSFTRLECAQTRESVGHDTTHTVVGRGSGWAEDILK